MTKLSSKRVPVAHPHTSPGARVRNLAESWARSLRARNLSDRTLGDYAQGLRYVLDYWEAHDGPERIGTVSREDCEAYLADCIARQLKPQTVATYHKVMNLFFKWCLEEGEIAATPMALVRRPKVDEGAVPPVMEPDDVRALLKACAGPDFRSRRDNALLRLMLDTGVRRMEVANMLLADVDLGEQLVTVRRKGKRAKLDKLPFGAKTAAALDRYLRARDGHKHAALPALWLTSVGPLSYGSIYDVVAHRAAAAGLGHIWPHVTRHTFSGTWLDMGGQESDLIELNGWSPNGAREMLWRYTRRQRQRRARDAHKRLAPGDQY